MEAVATRVSLLLLARFYQFFCESQLTFCVTQMKPQNIKTVSALPLLALPVAMTAHAVAEVAAVVVLPRLMAMETVT